MSFETNIQNVTTRVSTEVKALRTLLNGNLADLSTLSTTAKNNLVAAINELKTELDTIEIGAATESVAGVVELATITEAVTGVDTARAVTAAGLKAAIDAFRTALMGTDVPAALDTLEEIANALNDDGNFAATVTTALANRQPLDATLTALASLSVAAGKLVYATGADSFATTDLTVFARTLLDDATAADARTTLDVYSKTEIGDVNADFVATFEAGLV